MFAKPSNHPTMTGQGALVVSLLLMLLLTVRVEPIMADVRFTVERFVVEGSNPISAFDTMEILQPYTGPHDGIERLQAASGVLEKALNDRGFHFHRVTLPPQVLEDGVVTLEVRRLIVGDITTSGNKYFSDANLRRSLPQLETGATPDTRALSRALAVANFNSAKRTRLTFGRGDAEDTLDARIEVRDRPPRQYFAWLNNTGTRETTRPRFGAGYQHYNVLDRDHQFTATYTTSPEDPDKVQQYGFNYQVPLYGPTATVALFHVESDIDSGRVAEVFDVSGGGRTTGIRYGQILNKIGDLRQRAYVDVSDKLFDTDVDFLGNEIGVDVRSRPLSLTWQLEWEELDNNGRVNFTYNHNLDGGRFNDDDSYAASRAGASSDWHSWRINAVQDYTLAADWRLALALQAQYADEPLISGEQLGLGGSAGPRGFEEREGGVDRGANLRLQIWAPPLKSDLQLGAFVDHGFGSRLRVPPGEPDSLDLTSAGISAKWQWNNRLAASVDVGHVLAGFDEIPSLTQDGDTRAHASLVYRFNAN